jgi:hypothetical protein
MFMLDKMGYDAIKAKTRIVGYYDVLVNEDEEVLFAIPFKIPGEPTNPLFYYSGGMHAFLVKNHRTIVMCDFINPDVRSTITKNSKVLLVQLDEEQSVSEEYEAEIVSLDGLDDIGSRLLEDKADD